MASSDPLILLRTSLAASRQPLLTTTSDPEEAATHPTDSFSDATHLYFSHPTPQCLSLTLPTRFISTTPDTAKVDLRSVYFAWTQKDVTITDSIAVASEIDKALPEDHKIRTLVFGERIDLITWLEGASDSSEYIKAPDGAPGTADAATKAAEIAGGAGVPAVGGTGLTVTQQSATGRSARVIDARLQAIYNGERKMGDHNSVLRGIKPTVYQTI